MNIRNSSLYKSDLKKALEKLSLEELREKSILVTGGLGLVCSSLIDLLLCANESYDLRLNIWLATRSSNRFEERYNGVGCVSFCKYDALQENVFNFHADYIICGASLSSPDKYVTEPVETMLSNINGIKNLLEYANKEGSDRVLYISSSEVYGRKENCDPYVEGKYGSIDIDSLRSSYAVSKQAAELLCKSFSAEYGVNTVIVRPGHIFGPTVSSSDKRVSSDFAFKAARKESLILKSSGSQKRSYCYSVDASVAILIALLKGKNSEAYNIGTNEIISIKEMAEIYANIAGVSLEYQEPTSEERQAFNPMSNSSLDCDKIYKLGFYPTFTVKEGLEHTVHILQEILNE